MGARQPGVGAAPEGSPLRAVADDLLRRKGFLSAHGLGVLVRDADPATLEWVPKDPSGAWASARRGPVRRSAGRLGVLCVKKCQLF